MEQVEQVEQGELDLTHQIVGFIGTTSKGPTRTGLGYKFGDIPSYELDVAIDEAIQLQLIYQDTRDGRYKVK